MLMKLRASIERIVYRIVVLVPFLRREEMEIGIFSFQLSPYIKVRGRATNSISPCAETIPHWYEKSKHNMFGEIKGLLLNKEFRLFSQSHQ